MSDTPRPASLSAQASMLVSAVDEMNERLEITNVAIVELAVSGRRQRRLIRILAISLIFDVALSLGLAYLFSRSKEASDQNEATLRATCEDSNVTRAGSIQLWESIAQQSPQPTPEQQERARRILDLVHQTYAPRDCG